MTRPPEPTAPFKRPTQPVGRRAARGTLSRDRIVDAAARVVSKSGLEGLSVRGLATDLGVSPMALYKHVHDKDDLLDAVVDRLLERRWRPRVARDDWRSWTLQAAERLRRFLVSQPAALYVYLRHPVASPAAIKRMTAMLDVLRSGLGSDEAAQRAYASIHTFTLGFSALQANRAEWSPESADLDDVSRELASYSTTRQFTEGLGYLIDGVARQNL